MFGPADPRVPNGFRFGSTAAGIKPSGRGDVSIIIGDGPLVTAGVYTRNQIIAAPVIWCRERTPASNVRAVVTVAGNANACTGERGPRDTRVMAARVARQIGCDVDQVLVMATGIIGRHLPIDRVETGIDAAIIAADDRPSSLSAVADAIRTTDAFAKIECRAFDVDGHTYTIAAICKGAGMIAPNMATMLAVITTDFPITTRHADTMLQKVARDTFNQTSVDGHTSTNDTLLLLSSGDPSATIAAEAAEVFAKQLHEVAERLCQMLVADGEGASHFATITVDGAINDDSARRIARTVGASPLVKTALTGGDPNWGRIVSAAGYADEPIEPERVTLTILQTTIYRDGEPQSFDEADLSKQMQSALEIPIRLTVGDGPGSANHWTSDLTKDYVHLNSEYTT